METEIKDRDEIYNIIFNNQPLSCDEIMEKMKDRPTYKQLLSTLWFGIPGIRIYRKSGQNGSLLPDTYFTPNKFSNKKQYNELVRRYKTK